MKTKPWTEAELTIAKDLTLSQGEVAAKIGRTTKSVKTKREHLRKHAGLGKASAVAAPDRAPDHAADKLVRDNEYWKHQHIALSREYAKSLKENVVIDRLINDIKSMAPVAYSPSPFVHNVVRKVGMDRQTPESAVLLFSDTHIGKVTRREQTLNFSSYDFPIFLARLKFLETRVLSILEGHTTAPIEELVVAMLGDMLDGALQHGSEAGQRNVLFNQFYAGGHAIAQFIRNLAARVPKIRIKTAVGNHTRWGTQKKMPTENRYSNFDQLLYAFLQALTSDLKNVEWSLDEQPFSIFTVQGWNFFAAHGDHFHGGDKAFGIPLHSMARQVNATTQLFHKEGAPVPDYYLTGHLHRPIQIPTGLGDITVNGGFPGLDGYALTGNFNPVDPAQIFFRVHPKYGKIAEYKLQLKFADRTAPTYDLPKNFSCE